jgi:hypothetical protein
MRSSGVFDSPAFLVMDDDELTQLVVDGIDSDDRTAFGPVFAHIKASGETCPWCFDRVRRLYPEHTAAKLVTLQDGGTDTIALESLGATVNKQSVSMKNVDVSGVDARGDGSLLVDRPDGDSDPAAYYEVAPETRLEAHPWQPGETRYVPPRSKTICKTCAVIDHDLSEHRDRTVLLDAVCNIAAHLHRRYLLFDAVAATHVVHEAMKVDSLAGRGLDILQNAVSFGLYQAYNGSGRSRSVDPPTRDAPTPDANAAPTHIGALGD